MVAQILRGSVYHRRLRPVENRFVYGVFFLRLRLSMLESSANALFSLNRFNLASFHFRDHGARDGTHPLVWIRALLARQGIHTADGEIWLHCFPRVLGYAFNPVSFWFCHDRGGRLRAILAEVNNTFGEHHGYLLAHPDERPIEESEAFDARKVFYVSPFFPVEGRYAFRFLEVGSARIAQIDYLDDAGPILFTSIAGKPEPLCAATLLRAILAHPLMTFGVIARIHWQALRLWSKRLPFFAKPAPPPEEISR